MLAFCRRVIPKIRRYSIVHLGRQRPPCGVKCLRARSFGRIFRNKNVFRNICRLFCSWEQNSRNSRNGIQVFRNENSSQTNAYLHYSNYSYSGLIPNERALNCARTLHNVPGHGSNPESSAHAHKQSCHCAFTRILFRSRKANTVPPAARATTIDDLQRIIWPQYTVEILFTLMSSSRRSLDNETQDIHVLRFQNIFPCLEGR